MDWSDLSPFAEVPVEDGVHQPRSFPTIHGPSFHAFFPKQSACELLAYALGSDGRVDFPTVTEICEGVTDNVEEMTAVAQLLSAALQKDVSLHGDCLLALQLKALTVAHELLYDPNARRALINAPGLLAAIKRLRITHLYDAPILTEDGLSAVEGPARECVRLLTSEIYHSLEAASIQQL